MMEYKLRINARHFRDNELLDDLKSVAHSYGKESITQKEYNTKGKFSHHPFCKRFGSWNKALKKAGLDIVRLMNIPDEVLFDNLERIWIKFGRQPFYSEIRKPLSDFSIDVYCKRFGGWFKACRAFIKSKGDDPCFLKTPLRNKSSARSRNISERDKLRVFKRDHYACVICGRSPATHRGIDLHIDHKKPFSVGGNNSLTNLRTLCNKCNLGKGAEEGL